MADDNQKNTKNPSPLIIKKIKKTTDAGHHGGGWKVAYADFMTAMMAFFMLMWLLNMSSEEQKKGISNYFAPIGSSQDVAGTEGLMDGGNSMGDEGSLESMSGEKEIFPDIQYTELEIDTKAETENKKNSANDRALEENYADLKNALGEAEKQEAFILNQIKEGIEKTINEDPHLSKANENVFIQVSQEGLIINLIDKKPFSMFSVGSKEMNNRMKQLLQAVVKIIKKINNPLVISGHTDSLPYASKDGYNNWDLSTERAIITRRFLESEGYPGSQISSVIGKENKDPLNKNDLAAPENRRVSLKILRMEKSIKEEGEQNDKKL